MKHMISHDGLVYRDSFGRTVHDIREQAKTASTYAAGLRQMREGTEALILGPR